jgi:hypothetical protein
VSDYHETALRRYEEEQDMAAREEQHKEQLREDGESEAESQAIPFEHRSEFLSWFIEQTFNNPDYTPTKKDFYEAVKSGEVILCD